MNQFLIMEELWKQAVLDIVAQIWEIWLIETDLRVLKFT